MANQVILEFIGDPTGLKPVADALQSLGNLTEAQVKAFAKANQEFAKKMAEAFQKPKADIDNLSNAVKKIPDALSGNTIIEAARAFGKLGVELSTLTKEAAILTSQLKSLKSQLESLEEGAAGFERISDEAIHLESKLDGVQKRAGELSDAFTLNAAIDGLKGMGTALNTAQSAAELFGEKNEDLAKVIEKVKAAQSLLVGVQELGNLASDKGAAKTAVMAGVQKLYTFVTGEATAATRAFTVATLAIGGGLVIGALTLIATFWDDISEAIFGAKKNQEDYTKNQKDSLDAYVNEIGKVTTLKIEYEKANTSQERRIEILNELKQINPEYFGNLQKEAGLYVDITEAVNAYIASLEAQARIDELQKRINDLIIQKRDNQRVLNQIIQGIVRVDNPELTKRTFEAVIKNMDDEMKGAAEEIIKLRASLIKKVNEEPQIDIGDIINFDPNALAGDIADIRKIIADAFNIDEQKLKIKLNPEQAKQELTRVGKELKDDAEGRQETLKIPIDFDPTEGEKQKLGGKIAAVLSSQEVQKEVLDATQSVFDAIFTISEERRQRETDAQLAALETRQEQELKFVEQNAEAGVISEEQAQARKAAIEAKYRAQEKAIKLQAFNAEKQAKITQAIINGALSITNVLANMQDPTIVQAFKIAAIAANSIAIAAQIATIAAQKPPAFRMGTSNAPGGWAMVGEEGPELVHLPRGTKVITHPETQRFLTGMGIKDIAEKYGLPALKHQFELPSIDSEIRRVVNGHQGIAFDYKTLGKEIAAHSPKTSFIIDKNGIYTIVDDKSNSRTYYGNKYNF